MNVSSAAASLQRAIAAYQPDDVAVSERQMAVLKKVLDAQKTEGADLMKLLDGKGRIVDVRA